MNKKNILLQKADQFAFAVYKVTKEFPRSVPLNIIEGFARQSTAIHRRFLEISYGSLKETKYLLYFSAREEYLDNKSYKQILELTEEIGKMLWTKIQTLKNQQEK